jgi:hypothetical protein
VAGAVLLAAIGLGWLVWAMLFHGRPDVTSELVSFHVAGEHGADARFTVVRRDRGVAATCLLRAYAADHAVVGELNVPVGSSEPATATLDQQVRTERRATTVDLVGCTTADQPRPR